MSSRIVIAKQLYVGFDGRQSSVNVYNEDGEETTETLTVDLGFATYYEDNAACRKRQSTIDGWAKKSSREAEILENSPLPNFTISKHVTHGGGWNDLNVYWRIADPRGFELEISSGNLAKLFQYCEITKGTIKEECVWAFDKSNGSKPVLLPVNSEIYVSSVASTAIHEAKKLSMKDVVLGDVITLKNGYRGTYLGKQYLVCADNGKHGNSTQMILKAVQKHVIKTVDEKVWIKDALVVFSTPNIIKIEKADKPLTEIQAEKIANAATILSVNNIGNDYYSGESHFTFDKDAVGSIVLQPTDTEKVKSETSAFLAKYIKDRHHISHWDLPTHKDRSIVMQLVDGRKVMFEYFRADSVASNYVDIVRGYLIVGVEKESITFTHDGAQSNSYSYEHKYGRNRKYIEFKLADIETIYEMKVVVQHNYGLVEHSIDD